MSYHWFSFLIVLWVGLGMGGLEKCRCGADAETDFKAPLSMKETDSLLRVGLFG